MDMPLEMESSVIELANNSTPNALNDASDV